MVVLSQQRGYNPIMESATSPKRSAGSSKIETMDVRLRFDEKQAFRDAADIAGLPLSAWVRERLRRVAARELQEADRPIPFLDRADLGM